MVVLEPSVLEQELRFEQAVEALHLEQLAAEVAVEGFDERILPGCAGLDVTGGGAGEATPVAECLADELGAVVAADQLRSSTPSLDDPLEHADRIVGAHPPRRRRYGQ